MQLYEKGYIYGNPKKLKDGHPNRYTIIKNVCKIELYDDDGNIKNYTIIDVCNYKKVSTIRLSTDKNGYVTVPRRTGFSRLHQLIMNSRYIDHHNGNILDNREVNLRPCEHKQNCRNTKINKNNTSGFKGVWWSKKDKRWVAAITYNYKYRYLGEFKNKTDAAIAYNNAAVKYFGKFARPNEL